MRNLHFVWALSLALPAACLASDAPLAVSEARAFALDARPSPRAISTRSDLDGLWSVTYRQSESVFVVSPSGTLTQPVDRAGADGRYPWVPNAGGLWTLSNNVSGIATFSVRDALFGDIGSGTVQDPYRIADEGVFNEQLEISSVTNGFTFRLTGEADLLDKLSVPSGYGVCQLAARTYQLRADGTGLLMSCLGTDFAVDSVGAGPDRTYNRNEGPLLPVAYSPDGWAMLSDASSTLTVRSPKGVEMSWSVSGTGSRSVDFREGGLWTVTLASPLETLTAYIDSKLFGLLLIVK